MKDIKNTIVLFKNLIEIQNRYHQQTFTLALNYPGLAQSIRCGGKTVLWVQTHYYYYYFYH
jgi:hypothetical protein